ncbi:MAG: type II toxin-antitoxin system YoeB family toxin [Fusobacteriaceae bacterium]
MRIILIPKAQKELDFWTKTSNKVVLNRINALIEDILKHPYEGIGKPHALKHKL